MMDTDIRNEVERLRQDRDRWQKTAVHLSKQVKDLTDETARLTAELEQLRPPPPISDAEVKEGVLGWLRENRPDLIESTLEQWRRQAKEKARG